MSKLPAAFPRLQLLEIKGGDADTTYLSTAQNWHTIEKIKDSSNGYLTIRLLQLLTFDHLYCMEVTLSGIGGHYVRHRMTKALIAAIHNAPALEKLTVAVSKMDINDIEDLHARATRLRHLKFYNVYWGYEAANSEVNFQPFESLASISLNYIMLPTSRITAAVNVFRGWINYIGIKYPQLRGLEMDWVAELIDCTEVTRTALIPTLMKLKHIERYSISICPLEQSIFDVMNDNGTELQNFEFLVDTNDTVQNTFRSVQTAQSVSTISSLSLSWSVGVNPLLFSQSLADLCHHLKYLTRLEVPYGQYRGDACILLMDIVQNITVLKSLVFGDFKIVVQ